MKKILWRKKIGTPFVNKLSDLTPYISRFKGTATLRIIFGVILFFFKV